MSLVIPGVRAALTPQWVRHPLWQIARQVPAFHLDFTTGQAIERIGGRLGTFTRPSSVKNVWNGSQFVEVAADVPALQRDPATGLWGYLHEPAATNLCLQSASIGASPWSFGGNTTVTQNFGTAPDGTQTATRVEMPNNVGTFINQSIPTTVGVDYRASIYARATSGTSSFILNVSGAVTTVTLSTSWQRIEVTRAAAGSSVVFEVDNGAFATDYMVWGAQLETGPIATSPIITTGSAVTRAVDTWTWTGAQFSDWYNQAGGVIMWDAQMPIQPSASQFPGMMSFDDGSSNNSVTSGWLTNNLSSLSARISNVNIFNLYPVIGPSALRRRTAGRFGGNNNFVATNGISLGPNTDNIPTGLTRFRFGAISTVPPQLIYQAAYFPPGPAADRIQALNAL